MKLLCRFKMNMCFQRRLFLRTTPIVTLMFIFTVYVYLNLLFSNGLDGMIDPSQGYEAGSSVTPHDRQRSNFEKQTSVIWPDKRFYDEDRIANQLNFKPVWMNNSKKDLPLKTIFTYGSWEVIFGQHEFLHKNCLVDKCTLTQDLSHFEAADAVLFTNLPPRHLEHKNPHQVWILYLLESPIYAPGYLNPYRNVFNWTATYRHDSDIVAPYEKFVLHSTDSRTVIQSKDYAAGKTKLVAWFVSNCGSSNQRSDYVKQLQKYISVDIFGACGPLECPRNSAECSELLNKEYKFYLAFENSNCRDYITEKFFVTGLQHDVIPIVMGAAPEDYARAAPYHSYIHVDDFGSPRDLAQYLHTLDRNNNLYNEYFRWKGTGSFIDTKFWCRVCALLHDNTRAPHVYNDIEKWWRGEGVCIRNKNWRQYGRRSYFIANVE